MNIYKDKKETSGVTGYEIGEDHIIIMFKDNEKYLYDYVKPGKAHVDIMILLAKEGEGLATYINKYVKKNFNKKL